MSNIQTGAERMPHDLSHLGFLAGQIGRLITISTTPVIAGDSFEMDAVGALRLSPLRRGLRSEERFSRNAETDLVCRLLLEKKTSKGPKPLQLKLLTTYIPKTSAFTLAFSTSQRLRTTSASARTFFTFRHYITPSARNF